MIKETLVNVEGFTEGDTFFVDGPLWYDGHAELKTFNSEKLELHLTNKVPQLPVPLIYKVVNGYFSLIIIIEKTNNTYRMMVVDKNDNNRVAEKEENLEVKYGKTSGYFSRGGNDYVSISNKKVTTTFVIHSPDKVTVKTTKMPISVDLIKIKNKSA